MELVTKTIGQVLDDTVARFPLHDALVYVDRGLRYSYEQFGDRVELLARGLLGLGIRKGEHVAL
jgi:fatty-acyl-CoA synthase